MFTAPVAEVSMMSPTTTCAPGTAGVLEPSAWTIVATPTTWVSVPAGTLTVRTVLPLTAPRGRADAVVVPGATPDGVRRAPLDGGHRRGCPRPRRPRGEVGGEASL